MQIDEEFKRLIPPLAPEEYQQLEANLLADGCRDALVVWNDILVDGHNRLEICTRHNLPYNTLPLQFESRSEVILWIIRNQLGRRNLPDYIRVKLALRLKPVLEEQAKANQATSTGGATPQLRPNLDEAVPPLRVDEQIGKMAGVGKDTVRKVEYIEAHASPGLKEALENQEVSIHAAFKDLRRLHAIEERNLQIESIRATTDERINTITLLDSYDVIVIDPPWPYGTQYDPYTRRAANPYPEMSLDEIAKIQLPAAPDCVLWLWTTHKFMRFSFEILDGWGFEDKMILTWVKNRIGLGSWLRSQSEFCIMAVRGKPTIHLSNQSTVLQADVKEHSRKPDAFYELVDGLCVGTKLDYFAREARLGWHVFGNEL